MPYFTVNLLLITPPWQIPQKVSTQRLVVEGQDIGHAMQIAYEAEGKHIEAGIRRNFDFICSVRMASPDEMHLLNAHPTKDAPSPGIAGRLDPC